LTAGVYDIVLYAIWHCDRVPLTLVATGSGTVAEASTLLTADNSTVRSIYAKYAVEVLTAYPATGYRAVWSGACPANSVNTCTVTLSQSRFVRVSFVPDAIELPYFLFDTDKWNIKVTPTQYAKIVSDLTAISRAGITQLYSTGYADVRSNVAHNLMLGRNRARSAANYVTALMKKLNLTPVTITQLTAGQTQKFGTDVNYLPNRRAVISTARPN
jgi:outer membrane protein OmpA-like peptidoglycan-associated protein